MNFNRLRVALLVAAVLLVNQPLDASEIFSDEVTVFVIKPKVCIVERIGQDCPLSFNLQWRTREPMDVCLMQQQQVLQCWIDEQEVDETTDVILQQSIQVQLVDSEQSVLAQEDLEVNAAQPKNRRRRLRSAWSLF